MPSNNKRNISNHLRACTQGAREKLDAAERAYERAEKELLAAAVDYARAGTREYAFHHPRRRVIWCAAMGSQGLYVEPHTNEVTYFNGDYDFEGPDLRVIDKSLKSPEFVRRIDEVRDRQGFACALGGNLRLEFRGGEVHSDLTHWGAIDDPYPGYKKSAR